MCTYMSSIKLVNSMFYTVVWLYQSSKLSLDTCIYTWVNLNFKLIESPPSVRTLLWLMKGFTYIFSLLKSHILCYGCKRNQSNVW